MNNTVSWEIFVRPMEPLFWGPPRSGSAGEAHHIRSEFPPPIQSWQGMLRSHLLRAVHPALDLEPLDPTTRELLVGGSEQLPESWQLTGPYPACHTRERDLMPWLPFPRYVFSRKDPLNEQVEQCFYAHMIEDAQGGINDNQNANRLLGRPEIAGVRKFKNQDGPGGIDGWCSADSLWTILSGRAEKKQWSRRDFRLPLESSREFPNAGIRRETHAGLALDKSDGRGATAQHGMLYFLRQIRCGEQAGFYGRLSFNGAPPDWIDGLPSGAATWGRKNRIAGIENGERLCESWTNLCDGKHLPDSVGEGDAFWLLALSPVALKDPEDPLPELPAFKSLGLITGKSIVQGGYDMVNRKPRDNQRLLPAGTAWLFRLEGDNEPTRARTLQQLNNAFPLGERNKAQWGFGHTLVGLAPEGTLPEQFRRTQ